MKNVLNELMLWKKAHNVFICSISDLFYEKVPFEFIDKVIDSIKSTPRYNYQILTKRAKLMNEKFTTHTIPQNAWLGATVDVTNSKDRIDYLRLLPATIKFLSCEPLLEDLREMNLKGIDWVIVGAESGTHARPMKEEWAVSIMKQTEEQGAAFFFKQCGASGSDGVKRSKKNKREDDNG